MSYRIEVNQSAAKELKKIPKGDRIRIIEKIDSLSVNLPNPDTTKMKGTILFTKSALAIIVSFMRFKKMSY